MKLKIINTPPVAGPQENPLEISTVIGAEIARHDLIADVRTYTLVAEPLAVPNNVNLARITLKAGVAETGVNVVSQAAAFANDAAALAAAALGVPYELSAASGIVEVVEVYPGGWLALSSTSVLAVASVVFTIGDTP